MGVSVNTILDAGLLANGKFPDIYWDMNLTGSELKIVRYVFDNCLRLYTEVKMFPKGSDGSPRFWRGKERMADDCGVSYPTFRNSVRHLSELGIVTSMDALEEQEELYCIGLSSKFIDSLSTENNFRLDFLNLINKLYNNLTVKLIKEQIDLNKLPLFSLRENKLQETQDLYEFTENKNSDSQEDSLETQDLPEKPNLTGNQVCSDSFTSKTTKNVVRKAIIITRTPILLLPQSIRTYSAKEKLKMLQHVRTPYEKKVLQVVEYYEYKCRQAIMSSGFRALGKDFRNHKNWKFFTRLYDLCEENHWNYKVYIDAQFDRVKYWARKQSYPYANQFTSEGAIKYYKNYVKEYKEKNSATGKIKVKTEKIKSFRKQVIEDIVSDCEKISDALERAGKRRSNKGMTPGQLKVVYLSDHWMSLSVFYLASVPWFLTYLNQFPEETFLVDLKHEISQIRHSSKKLNLVTEIVSKVENQMGIPQTLSL